MQNTNKEMPSSSQNNAIEEDQNLEKKIEKNFLSGTIEELKLVVWPTKQQLFSESIAVILMVTFSAAFIASVSRFYSWASSQIFR